LLLHHCNPFLHCEKKKKKKKKKKKRKKEKKKKKKIVDMSNCILIN